MASAGVEGISREQQGAVEAVHQMASDPQSAILPEAAEKVLVEEARKAGAAAYRFDPNASPEEKAAAVKSSRPANILPEKKPKGVTVATDLDKPGPDKYDLPPPSKALDEVETALVDGGAKQANGHLTSGQQWQRDRAPHFEKQPQQAGEGEESLLDHQTLLESKLDDKFFGDWYHNAGVIVFACLASWIVAILGGGLGWIFIVMATCGTYYRTSIRRVRRNFRDDLTREMAKRRLETDTESLEWINSFLVKFWPIYTPVLCESIINSVDQVLSTATPAFLDSLRLKTFVLGTKPPRLEHVKTYPKTEPDIVLMDWQFSFTPSDVMDLTARQLKDKINPKVVLEVRVGMGVVSKGLDVIVEDFAFSGLIRVRVKLQIPFPHIERVEICFLGRPEMDYVCKPLGGETLGFDINFIPGLESFIKEQIHGNLGPMMYEPNVFPIEIAKMIAGNPMDQAIGVVAVTLHGAANLKNSDKFGNSTDPYAVVSLNSRTPGGQTKTAQDTTDPRWHETIYIIITSFTDALTVHVYDYNEFRKDKELGIATFALDKLEHVREHENLNLDILSSGRNRGILQADVRFFPVMEGRKLENGTVEPAPELNTGIARFTVEQAKDLDGTKNLNPYAILLLNGKEIHTTGKLKRTNNPIFQNSSKEILIADRKSARLGLVIKDDRDLVAHPILGQCQIKMNDMLKMMENGKEWYPLSDAKSGRVKITLTWKPVSLRGIAGSAGYINPVGVMRLHFMSANDLRNLETMGKSDPYVRVLLSGIMKGRTVTFKNNLNPDWDEVVYVPIHSSREKLTIEVMDEETLGKDRSLGEVELPVSDYIHEGENGEYEVDDEKQPISSGLCLHGRGAVKGFLKYTVAFYPTVNVVDPEEDTDETAQEAEDEKGSEGRSTSKAGGSTRKSLESHQQSTELSKANGCLSVEASGSKLDPNGDRADSETASMISTRKATPKIYISPEDLQNYESGLIVFKFIDGNFSHSNVQLEVVLDDHMFPSYTSQKTHSKQVTIGDIGDAFVRELEVSEITLRLVEKSDKDGTDPHIIAKLTGQTLPTLQRCLYAPKELTIRANDGGAVNKVRVSLRFIPVKMKLDPMESKNNSGSLRVEVLDAADLPSADRNGLSDPYCKFKLAGKEVYKTKVQKKTLHPSWNEFFETPIKSRIGADFRVDVYDWDFGDKAEYLGGAPINLEMLEPFSTQEMALTLDGKCGAIRLKFLFKPSYVVRSRQGSSTFSGTFATPGKIVGVPVKGVGIVGGGVVKGASFLGKGLSRFLSDKDREEDNESTPASANGIPESSAPADVTTPQRAPALLDGVRTPTLTPDSLQRRHSRTRSIVSQFGEKLGVGGTPGSADIGTAMITILSASGFPPSAHVRVYVKLLGPKGSKEVHKTKAIKSSSGAVQFDQLHEGFRVPNVTGEAQYQVRVVDHATFGSDEVFGEAPFFVDDQGSVAGKEKTIKIGVGSVVIRSSFTPAEPGNGRPSTAYSTMGDDVVDSPDSKRISRRGFLSKRTVSSS